MSMPYGSVEEPDATFTMPESIALHVASEDSSNVAPEFGRWRTVTVANVVGPNSATPGAQRLLNRSQRRHKARLFIRPSIAAQTVTDGVIVGGRDEITSGAATGIGALGGYLPIGANVTYEAQAELWVCYPASNANTVYVTVLDEIYAAGD